MRVHMPSVPELSAGARGAARHLQAHEPRRYRLPQRHAGPAARERIPRAAEPGKLRAERRAGFVAVSQGHQGNAANYAGCVILLDSRA
jgi:hypothetical protein